MYVNLFNTEVSVQLIPTML